MMSRTRLVGGAGAAVAVSMTASDGAVPRVLLSSWELFPAPAVGASTAVLGSVEVACADMPAGFTTFSCATAGRHQQES